MAAHGEVWTRGGVVKSDRCDIDAGSPSLNCCGSGATEVKDLNGSFGENVVMILIILAEQEGRYWHRLLSIVLM